MFYQFSKCKLIISTNIKHDFYKNKSQTLHMTNFIKNLNFFNGPKILKTFTISLIQNKKKKPTFFYFHPPFEKKKNINNY